MPATQVTDSNQVGQTARKPIAEVSLPKQPIELKPLLDHLKYAYLSNEQQFPVLRQHKKAIGSNTDPLYTFDLEIALTLRRLRKIRNTTINISSSVNFAITSNQSYTDNFVASTNIFTESGQMENHDRTLKELATPDVVYQPWCIQYPQLEPAQTYELKSGLIHLLPKFHASRTATIRKEICGIRQHTGETLHEYWERFNKLYATCPHHQISE
ncbi:hypothetical protein CR513_24019, partial [Mucuna pruriens]